MKKLLPIFIIFFFAGCKVFYPVQKSEITIDSKSNNIKFIDVETAFRLQDSINNIKIKKLEKRIQELEMK